jgi:hypothetical protein
VRLSCGIGNFYPGITSFIVSHVADEASSFVPNNTNTYDDFFAFVEKFFPSPKLQPVRDRIRAKYYDGTCKYWWDGHIAPSLCLQYVIRDAFFVCNTRQLFDAYSQVGTAMYMMQYFFFNSYGGAKHSFDLVPTFYFQDWYSSGNLTKFLKDFGELNGIEAPLAAGAYSAFAPRYQSYFASHAISGDPNTYQHFDVAHWETADVSENKNYVEKVLETQYVAEFPNWDFRSSYDELNKAETCGFWVEIAEEVMRLTRSEGQDFVVQGVPGGERRGRMGRWRRRKEW